MMNMIMNLKFDLRSLTFSVIGLGFCGSSLIYAADIPANQPYTCDVAIIGGGPGGVHTAYKLTTMGLTSGKVCLFEKSDHLGGRVGNNSVVGQTATQFTFTDANGTTQTLLNSGQTGTGGYRMYFNQYVYKLGNELAAKGLPGELTLLPQRSFSRLLGIERNNFFSSQFPDPTYFTYDNFGVAKAFARIYKSPINNNDIWKTLLCGPQVPKSSQNFPQYTQMNIPGIGNMTMRDYLQWVAKNVIAKQGNGPQIAQYLMDTWRFRADFESNVDAISYLQFTAKDYLGGATYYPIPSFQPYFDIMEKEINSHNGVISKNNAVLTVNYEPNTSLPKYVITTSKGNTVHANTVIIATPHTALGSGGMTGSVISAITSQPIFNSLNGARSVTVTHQFGDGSTPNSGWWNPASNIFYTGPATLLGSQLTASSTPLRRSVNNIMIPGDNLGTCPHTKCDFSSTLFYNNTNELPLTVYHDWINISRSVYNDDAEAVKNWEDLYLAGGETAVNNQVLKSLRVMYPNVFNGTSEPAILNTDVTIHKPAWYNLAKGAFGGAFGVPNLTNDKLFAWSKNPLPGERVYLVGDAWRPDLSGWSEAAYKGSIHLLNNVFGANIDPKEEATIKCVNGDLVDPN